MKVLIWILWFFVSALIFTFFRILGISLGGIPTVIIWGTLFLAAQGLCKLWDEHKGKDTDSEKSV